MRCCVATAVLTILASSSLAQHIAPTEANSPANQLKTFKVPEGFEVQLVAAEPDIGKPIQLSFDHRGRLWVTTSRHYPFPAEKGESPSDRVFILSDFGEDGRAKTITTFAQNLNIPIGVLPLPEGNACLVSHVGSIIKLTDTNNDGQADQQETILTGFGSRDTHGMMNSFVLLPDGWVYACHGFANESQIRAKDGSELKLRSGNTFRFRPDGSRVEPWTFGQVNPFGMTVDPYLNLYTADCHTKPITQLIRGSYYDSFGAPHDGLGYGPHATPHSHGSTALCGLAWYDAPYFPKAWRGTMFLGNVVTNRVNADRIEWKGGSPIAHEMTDFLVSSDPWFRPTDIKLGPDGALYVADFYNRIIGHYEVDLKHPLRDKDRGRIWRIVRQGTPPKMPNRDLAQLPTNELVRLLIDENLTVRLNAANDLARRLRVSPTQLDLNVNETDLEKVTTLFGLVALAGEQSSAPPISLDTYDNILKGIKDRVNESPTAFTGLMIRAIASRDEWTDRERAMMKLTLDELANAPFILRAALDGIIGQPHAEFIPLLLKVHAGLSSDDVNTRHAVKIALRNCLKQPGGWDQTQGLPDDQFTLTAEAALGIHDAASVKFVLNYLEQSEWRPAMALHVGRYGTTEQADEFLRILAAKKLKLRDTLTALLPFSQGLQARSGTLSAAGRPVVAKLCEEALQSADAPSVQAALDIVAQQKLQSFRGTLEQLVKRADRRDELRLAALSTWFKLDPKSALDTATTMLSDIRLSPNFKEKLALQLGGLPQAEARQALVAALQVAPAQLARGFALALSSSPAGADELLKLIEQGKVSPRLLQEKALAARIESHNAGRRRSRVAALTKGLPSADAKLEQIIRERQAAFAQSKPDPVAGKQIFTQKCGICHQIANQGAKVGPNLDGIGSRGSERLLEDILDPNRNIDATFRATILNLVDGRTLTGQLVREEGDLRILVDAQGQEIRVPKADIESQSVSPLSVMPANFHELPEQELFNLLGYLLGTAGK